MNRSLKLVVNNFDKKLENKYFFEKDELKTILDLYAKMVSEGSWKDYGLNISNRQVGFSVFKNASVKKKIIHLLFSKRHPTSLSIIDFPRIFFNIGSFVKYFPNNKAKPNKIFIIVGLT